MGCAAALVFLRCTFGGGRNGRTRNEAHRVRVASGRPTKYAGHCGPYLRTSLGRIDECSVVCRRCFAAPASSFHLIVSIRATQLLPLATGGSGRARGVESWNNKERLITSKVVRMMIARSRERDSWEAVASDANASAVLWSGVERKRGTADLLSNRRGRASSRPQLASINFHSIAAGRINEYLVEPLPHARKKSRPFPSRSPQ